MVVGRSAGRHESDTTAGVARDVRFPTS
jgi:hypothetical protein